MYNRNDNSKQFKNKIKKVQKKKKELNTNYT